MRRLIDLGVVDWVCAGRASVPPILDADMSSPASCPSYPEAGIGYAFGYRNLQGELVYCEMDEVPPFPMRGSVRHFGPCITTRCVHWSNHCNLGAVLSRAIVGSEESALNKALRYRECRIQKTCRWKGENGIEACIACADVDYFTMK